MSSSQVTNCARIAAGVSLLLLLAACGHEAVRRLPADDANGRAIASHAGSPPAPRQPAAPAVTGSVAKQAAVNAVRQIGVPYVYGGSSERGFDCSGLVQYAYSRAGRRIPRTTAAQWRTLSPVAKDELQVGDVLFFRIEGKIAHVGLYLGDRRFVHAPSSGREVTVAGLDSDYYRRALVRGGRP